jgi:hypothetical protein
VVDLSETGVSRAERCDGVFSDKPRVYQKHVENCGNVGVLRQLNLLCDVVGKLQTLGPEHRLHRLFADKSKGKPES